MSDAATADTSPMLTLNHLPYEMDGGIAERAAIGVIVLASDHTMEHEFRTLLDMPGVAFYESRIWNSNVITPDTLRAMEDKIEDCTGVILPGAELDVVAFGCTSASMVIGEEKVFQRILSARPEVACTTPITSAFAAFRAFGARRIGVITPYREDVNAVVREYIENKGFEVPVFASFNEEDDNKVSRISKNSLLNAVEQVRKASPIDALFVSCTSVRLAEFARDIETETGIPVTSSNHAMAWHCLRLAGVRDERPEFGKLFELQID